MAGLAYVPMLKLKRKDLEEVNDDFSDFSLSAPPRKIRRLDAELPPIMEEEEAELPLVHDHSMPENNFASNLGQVGGPVIEELPENEERALVLFKPMNAPLLRSPSDFFVSVNSDLISGFKNRLLWSGHSNPLRAAEDEAASQDDSGAKNESLAVVPWVPSQLPPTQPDVSELMDAEETEVVTMDIEDNNVNGVGTEQRNESGGMSVTDGLHQWQQHCMIPQLPQNTSTPIVWFR